MLLRESKKCTWQIVDGRGETLEKWRVEIAQVCFTGFHGQDTDGTDLAELEWRSLHKTKAHR